MKSPALYFLGIILSTRTIFARWTCPSYDELATPFATTLDPKTYEGLWYEVYSHNVFLVESCHCTRYNWTLGEGDTFTDDFTCHKKSPDSDLFVIHNKGSFDANAPGKMVESLGPASPPYWVLAIWGEDGKLLSGDANVEYAYALVYACVGSPLLGEYTYFFSRNDTIPDSVYADMRSYAETHKIGLSSVKKVPMEGCSF